MISLSRFSCSFSYNSPPRRSETQEDSVDGAEIYSAQIKLIFIKQRAKPPRNPNEEICLLRSLDVNRAEKKSQRSGGKNQEDFIFNHFFRFHDHFASENFTPRSDFQSARRSFPLLSGAGGCTERERAPNPERNWAKWILSSAICGAKFSSFVRPCGDGDDFIPATRNKAACSSMELRLKRMGMSWAS